MKYKCLDCGSKVRTASQMETCSKCGGEMVSEQTATVPKEDLEALVGEVEQTIATLRGEADELESIERAFDLENMGIEEVYEQLRYRADELAELVDDE